MRAFIVILFGLLVACDPLDEGSDGGVPVPVEPEHVAGVWTIHGAGKMEGCSIERYNTDALTFTSQALRVQQTGADLLSESVDFRLSGRVDGALVAFTTQERTRDGSIQINFDGEVEGDGVIRGRFDGSSPGACSLSGTFHINVAR